MQNKESAEKIDINETIKKGQSFLGLLYLLMIAIGMIFSYKNYAEYGINIFEYADVFDFFIAPFTDFYIIIFACVTLFLFFLLLYFDSWLEKKSPKLYRIYNMGLIDKPWYKSFTKFNYVVLFILYLILASSFYANYTVGKMSSAKPITLTYSDNSVIIGKQIGKTKEVIFLQVDKEVYAIPITSLIKDIKINVLENESASDIKKLN